MGFSIQIRHKDKLVIPKGSGYKPPMPKLPNYISLAFEHMELLVQMMAAARILDMEVLKAKDKKKCRPGLVPAYKFCLNEGYVVTAEEAAAIAESLAAQDIVSAPFLKKLFPKKKKVDQETKDLLTALMALWIPYNRVAAANDGYTIK